LKEELLKNVSLGYLYELPEETDSLSVDTFLSRLTNNYSFSYLTTSDCIDFLKNFLKNEDSNFLFSLLSFEKKYLISLIFLLKENLITLEDLEKIIESSSIETREEMVIRYLTKISPDILLNFLSNGIENIANNNNEISSKEEVLNLKNSFNSFSIKDFSGLISDAFIEIIQKTNNESVFSNIFLSNVESNEDSSFKYSPFSVANEENYAYLASDEKAVALFIKNFINGKY